MGKKRLFEDGGEPGRSGREEARAPSERDLVALYSRLVETLERAGGRDALARRLAELRRAPPADPVPALREAAFGRAFRRIGLIGADAKPLDFAGGLAREMGEAVSRPVDHVLFLWKLFCHGDDSLKAICGPVAICRKCLLTRECDFYNTPRKPAVAAMTPAERLMSGNDSALSDGELVSVLVFGEKATGLEPLTTTLLTKYGRLRALFRADAPEYPSIRDMGRPHALRLAAANAIHRRLLREQREETPRITCAKDMFDRYAAELREHDAEEAVLLLLDKRNRVIRDAWFDDAPPSANIANLLRPAVRESAVRVALVHHHPSNNPEPSVEDMEFTRRLRAACDIIGLGLLDHVIVAGNGYYSFAEQSLL